MLIQALNQVQHWRSKEKLWKRRTGKILQTRQKRASCYKKGGKKNEEKRCFGYVEISVDPIQGTYPC